MFEIFYLPCRHSVHNSFKLLIWLPPRKGSSPKIKILHKLLAGDIDYCMILAFLLTLLHRNLSSHMLRTHPMLDLHHLGCNRLSFTLVLIPQAWYFSELQYHTGSSNQSWTTVSIYSIFRIADRFHPARMGIRFLLPSRGITHSG
jgi:hypothetical protein